MCDAICMYVHYYRSSMHWSTCDSMSLYNSIATVWCAYKWLLLADELAVSTFVPLSCLPPPGKESRDCHHNGQEPAHHAQAEP